MAEQEHEFGGQHTEIKLELVEKYLQAYMAALRRKFDNLWYIDAFAGTGNRTVRVEAKDGDLFDTPAPARTQTRRGSARIALDVKPAFDRLIFMDANPEHCVALKELKNLYPGRNIDILEGDANRLIQDQIKWDGWKNTRAVMFLDPYGMEVEWSTLQAIAETRAIDVWYLFSLSGLYRQAARNINSVDDSKRRALTRMFGSDQWERELYSPIGSAQSLLEGLDPIQVRQRNADVTGLETYVRERLESIFPMVLDPFPLPPNSRPQRFSLFFAISNPSTAASDLAKRFGNHILASGRSSHVRSR
jgi:three-Cys-motif partner protein